MKSIYLTLLLIMGYANSYGQFGIVAYGVGAAVRDVRKNRSQKSLNRLEYRIDTFHFYGKTALMQRYDEADLMHSMGDDAGQNVTATELIKVQKELDDIKYNLESGASIGNPYHNFDYIKRANPRFDFSIYEKEYDFYKDCYHDITVKRREIFAQKAKEKAEKDDAESMARMFIQRSRDSIYMAQERERRAEYNREEDERRRVSDSLFAVDEKIRIRQEKIQAAKDAEASRKAKFAAAEKKKKRHDELVEKYGAYNAELIENKQIQIGWTKQMCIASWGKPQDINRTIAANYQHEQWVYNIKTYLYFEGELLTTIQN